MSNPEAERAQSRGRRLGSLRSIGSGEFGLNWPGIGFLGFRWQRQLAVHLEFADSVVKIFDPLHELLIPDLGQTERGFDLPAIGRDARREIVPLNGVPIALGEEVLVLQVGVLADVGSRGGLGQVRVVGRVAPAEGIGFLDIGALVFVPFVFLRVDKRGG